MLVIVKICFGSGKVFFVWCGKFGVFVVVLFVLCGVYVLIGGLVMMELVIELGIDFSLLSL